MEPKEKAEELISRFNELAKVSVTKECALIAVEEIIGQWQYIDTYIADMSGELNPNLRYWVEVKKEIENL